VETVRKLIGIPFRILGTLVSLLFNGILLVVVTGLATTVLTQGDALGIVTASSPVTANYPSQVSRYVNDYADQLSPAEEAALRGSLTRFERDAGVPFTVLIIGPYTSYGTGDASLESFATNLFNTWGIGTNGALLVLSVQEGGHGDVRIELGREYGHDFDAALRRVVDQEMLPHFRAQQYSQGVDAGVQGVIQTLSGEAGPPSWLDALRDALGRGGAAVRNGLVVVLILASVALTVRDRLFHGGLAHNLTSLSLAMVGGAAIGLVTGAAVGAIEVNPTAFGETMRQMSDILSSPAILDRVFSFSRSTVVGATSGVLGAAILWFLRGSHGYGSYGFGGGSSGGGSSGGGGAGGSW
jgi:uncharacterized membrane protein YgcG